MTWSTLEAQGAGLLLTDLFHTSIQPVKGKGFFKGCAAPVERSIVEASGLKLMGICCAKLAKQEARRKAYCSFDIMLLMCSSPRMWSPYQQNVVQPCMSCPRQPSVVECRGIHKGLMLSKHLAWSVGSMVLQAGSLGQVLFLMEKQKKLLTALCSTMDALHLQLV